MKTVCISGGAGYIGSYLTYRLLDLGYQVRVIDSLVFGGNHLLPALKYPSFSFARCDIRDGVAVADIVKGCNSFIHLAAIVGAPESSRNPQLTDQINYEATKQLLNIAEKNDVSQFVFASTCSNYGMADISKLAKEDAILDPKSPYAITKVNAERDVLKANTKDFTTTVLRFSTVFGVSPRMRFDLLVNEFVRDALYRKNIQVFKASSWRPVVHVKDVCLAIQTVMESTPEKVAGEVFNVGDEDLNVQKGQLAEKVKEIIPSVQIKYPEETTDPRDYRVSFEKIKEKLGYKAQVSLENGLLEIYQLLESGIIPDPYAPEFKNDGADFNLIFK